MFSLQAYPSDGCCCCFFFFSQWPLTNFRSSQACWFSSTWNHQLAPDGSFQVSATLQTFRFGPEICDPHWLCSNTGLKSIWTKPSAFSLDSKFPRNHRFPHRFVNWNLLGSRQQLESSLVLPCCAGQLLRSRHCALQRLWLHQWPMQLGSQDEAIQD